MTSVERFRKTLAGDLKGLDRLPMIEWAGWWHLTRNRWDEEGLSKDIPGGQLYGILGLDDHRQHWFSHKTPECPEPQKQGGPIVETEADYDRIKPFLYPSYVPDMLYRDMTKWKEEHDNGEIPIWFSMDGGFWFPRTLLGIQGHLYAFYDEPDLYHRILEDLAAFQKTALEAIYSVCVPEFMTFAEDMSYNKGPMLSEKMFNEFLLPYYQKLTPYIRSHGTHVLVDSDGNITEMVPWLLRAGIEGALPLEYQAGVDVQKLREKFPEFIMVGGFNKRVMKDGEEAMTAEFERLLPVMRSGRYIPSVDHQTPPDVSLENYRTYIRLLKKYAELAVK